MSSEQSAFSNWLIHSVGIETSVIAVLVALLDNRIMLLVPIIIQEVVSFMARGFENMNASEV